MLTKRYISQIVALVLVLVIGLMGCSANSVTGLTGNYRQDALTLLNTMRTAIELPDDAADKGAIQAKARQSINEFAARYRRDRSLSGLTSFTTIRTALNALASHYSGSPNRPIPQTLKDRLEAEFRQVESALRRGA